MTKVSILDNLVEAAMKTIDNDYHKQSLYASIPNTWHSIEKILFQVYDRDKVVHKFEVTCPRGDFDVKRTIKWNVSDKKDYFMGDK